MLIVNFSHPLTTPQLEAIRQAAGERIEAVRDVAVHFDVGQPFAAQATAALDRVGLNADQWQTTSFVINLPQLSPAAAAVLAEVHGRCGYFPAVIRMRPYDGPIPGRYDFAELVSLQQIRDTARARRTEPPKP